MQGLRPDGVRDHHRGNKIITTGKRELTPVRRSVVAALVEKRRPTGSKAGAAARGWGNRRGLASVGQRQSGDSHIGVKMGLSTS
ncbi:hypothetical protein E2562_026087 [Oryza meyeriana var. granulata]|uniref:Uncharacterized protein n=1 Tax=Oryza meyeriana var. granulata TaxID=110450 RepID=A0A6G1EZ02_9ORYZ|nr:hypothetical protein E2562_026087 [Oryza meyeriana var. granulata]